MALFYLRSSSSSTFAIHQLYRHYCWTKTQQSKLRLSKPNCHHSNITIMSSSTSNSTRQSSTSLKSTPDLCDDYEDTIRIVDPTLGLKNLGGKNHFGGIIATCKIYEDNSCVKQLAKTDGKGKVMVVDGGGSRRRALLGDQVATDCIKNGWEGLVIYGSIRDVDEISKLTPPLGVQALGTHPMKTLKRNEGQINIPITFGGVTFKPGEYIVCDNNGIVVLNETHITDTTTT